MAALTPFINDVEEKVTCSICSEIFTDPKTLPCLHSYCTKCITQLYEKSEELGEQLACPQCPETRIDLSEQRDADHRRSFYIDALIKLLSAMKNASTQDKEQEDMLKSKCTSCEKYAVLVAFCPQCKGMICQDCFGAHKSVNQLRHNHQATMLSEFKQEHLKDFVEKQMLCMEESHDEKSDQPAGQYFYCKEDSCKRFICQWCLLMAHRNHDTEIVEKAGEQFKKTIKEDIDRLEKVKEGYEEELSLSKQNMVRILSEVELARLKIDEEKNALIKMANDHVKAMNEALDKLLLDQQTLYQDEQSSINKVKKQVTEYQDRCQNVIERNVPYDMSERQELIQGRTKALSQPSVKPMKRLRVRYNSVDHVGCFGSIVENVIDPSRSSIESLKEVRQGFLNEFEIVTRNADGKIWYAQDESIIVTITRTNDNNEEPAGGLFMSFVDKEVIDEKNGTYRVRFRAAEATQYEIRASIGFYAGGKLKNSPQIINTPSIDAKFNPLKTFGEYGVGKGQLLTPRSIAIGNGKMAIADSAAHRILLFDLDGKNLQEFGSKSLEGGGGELTWPFGVVFVKDRILVSDQPGNGRIQEFDSEGTYIRTIYRPKEEFMPRGMCVAGDNVAVCCHRKMGHVMLLSKEREVIEEFAVTGGIPLHITFGDRKYFVSFVNKNYIHAFNKDGELVFTFRDLEEVDGLLNTVYGLSFYGDGMILVCDGNNHRVEQYTKEGRFVQSFGTLGSGIGQMLHPLDVAVSADGRVFVLELEGIRVHVWK